jgi:hypothetical protein
MTDDLAEVLLEPGNPYDMSVDELAGLQAEIIEAVPDVDVFPALRPEAGYGVTFVEVLHVWIQVSEAVDAAAVIAGVTTKVVAWMRRRWQVDQEEHPGTARPRNVVIYGPTGEPLREVGIEMPMGEPVERAPDREARQRRRPQPSSPGESERDSS